jgi:hypothetical protein
MRSRKHEKVPIHQVPDGKEGYNNRQDGGAGSRIDDADSEDKQLPREAGGILVVVRHCASATAAQQRTLGFGYLTLGPREKAQRKGGPQQGPQTAQAGWEAHEGCTSAGGEGATLDQDVRREEDACDGHGAAQQRNDGGGVVNEGPDGLT